MPDRLTARILTRAVDPEDLFLALEADVEDIFWLDAGAGATDGWSYVGTGDAAAVPRSVRLDGASDAEPAAPPLRGGWVGWMDYEAGARAAGAPIAEDHGEPHAAGMRITRMVAFDHSTGRAWAVADEPGHDDWAAYVTSVGSALAVTAVSHRTAAVARHTPVEYAELIERCRESIRAGTAYQLCLTTRFSVPGEHDAVAAYRRLRTATPAHHGGFLRIGGVSLLSASPEQFLHADGGVIRTRPIKGTRPRGRDAADDAALAAELAVDPKERAENVMIVDLMRNDLSRVCEPGSIRVDALWAVETYPAVHQLVSTVSGTAAAGTTFGDLLAAAFPAGSMTGAPKLSAMSELHALEGGPRGLYSGCFGYVGDGGTIDLAMVIRSVVLDGHGARVGAGGGITWRSVAASEVAEVATKAKAPLAALGAEMPGAWASDILS
nr:anthranilate synthase component I family protein [Microbacterium hydrocarbonoxydans]